MAAPIVDIVLVIVSLLKQINTTSGSFNKAIDWRNYPHMTEVRDIHPIAQRTF